MLDWVHVDTDHALCLGERDQASPTIPFTGTRKRSTTGFAPSIPNALPVALAGLFCVAPKVPATWVPCVPTSDSGVTPVQSLAVSVAPAGVRHTGTIGAWRSACS